MINRRRRVYTLERGRPCLGPEMGLPVISVSNTTSHPHSLIEQGIGEPVWPSGKALGW